MNETQIRNKVVSAMLNWLGGTRGSVKHIDILNIYNAHKPLPRGYAVKINDPYCATAVSAAWIATGVEKIVDLECSVPKMVTLSQKRKIWVENDAYIPKPGDAIVYDWDDTGKGDNVGYPDHVGIVESVTDKKITVIEGNINGGKIGRRTIDVNGKYIRGFICPNYKSIADPEKTIHELALECIDGKWGNGAVRKNKLTKAGYDYDAVQAEVNAILSKKKSIHEIALECIAGKWGNGAVRKNKLTKAGYNYAAVQAEVNKILKK